MQITLKILNLKISQHTKKTTINLFSKKLAPLLKDKGSCDLTFSSENSLFHGKANINIPGEVIHAEASNTNYHKTSLLLLERIKRQIEKKNHSFK